MPTNYTDKTKMTQEDINKEINDLRTRIIPHLKNQVKTEKDKKYKKVHKATLKSREDRLKELVEYRASKVTGRIRVDKQKVANAKKVANIIKRKGYQSAPAFDSFPKESQVKQHPLYGNLRY